MIALALTLALLGQSADETAYVEQVRGALRACGVISEPGRLEYDDELQEYAVSLDGPEVDETVARCLANTPLLDSLTLTFADPHLTEIHSRAFLARPNIRAAYVEMAERQRTWLKDRGLLDTRPLPDPGQPLSTYTAKVEAHCGVPPGSMLAADDKTRGLSLVGRGLPSDMKGQDQMMCVFTVVTLAMMDDPASGLSLTGEDSAP